MQPFVPNAARGSPAGGAGCRAGEHRPCPSPNLISGARIHTSILPTARRAALDALTAGEVDLAVGVYPNVSEPMTASPLY